MTANAPVSDEWLERASKLWASGMTTSQIAAVTGIPRGTVCTRVFRHRDYFPMRGNSTPTLPKPPRGAVEPARRTYIAGKWVEHVTRTTSTGAEVTMPRVSFIDGVREGVD